MQTKLTDEKTRISSNQDPNEEWEALKNIIKETVEQLQRDDTSVIQPKKHWITQRTFETIKERKRIKNRGLLTEEDSGEYRKLSKKIQRQCRQDKNNHRQYNIRQDNIKEVCREIEEHHHTNDTRDLYKKVREFVRKFKPKTMTIEDKDGKVIWENQEVLKRGRQYCEELYNEETDTTSEQLKEDLQKVKEPNILLSC